MFQFIKQPINNNFNKLNILPVILLGCGILFVDIVVEVFAEIIEITRYLRDIICMHFSHFAVLFKISLAVLVIYFIPTSDTACTCYVVIQSQNGKLIWGTRKDC
jgi:membrane-bound metal-dependent hydrolase YbcI (DUF457 family)